VRHSRSRHERVRRRDGRPSRPRQSRGGDRRRPLPPRRSEAPALRARPRTRRGRPRARAALNPGGDGNVALNLPDNRGDLALPLPGSGHAASARRHRVEGAMSEIMIRCPETGNEISTGIHCDGTSFEQLPFLVSPSELSAVREAAQLVESRGLARRSQRPPAPGRLDTLRARRADERASSAARPRAVSAGYGARLTRSRPLPGSSSGFSRGLRGVSRGGLRILTPSPGETVETPR
jgi:hypothetical protein